MGSAHTSFKGTHSDAGSVPNAKRASVNAAMIGKPTLYTYTMSVSGMNTTNIANEPNRENQKPAQIVHVLALYRLLIYKVPSQICPT